MKNLIKTNEIIDRFDNPFSHLLPINHVFASIYPLFQMPITFHLSAVSLNQILNRKNNLI